MSRETEQILKNQVVIMGMLQDLQDELEPIQNIEDTHQLLVDKNNGWVSVKDSLPKDGDCRFYLCIMENHEEELPMFCQYDEDYGFGFYHDIYDTSTLGFIDSEFKTNEELGYEEVVAWQQIPEYQSRSSEEETDGLDKIN